MSWCWGYLASIFFTFYISVYYRRVLFIYKYKKSNRIPSEHNTVCLSFIKGDLVFVKKTFLSQINGSGWARGWFEFMLDSIKRSAVVNATDLSLLAPFPLKSDLGCNLGRALCALNSSSLKHWGSQVYSKYLWYNIHIYNYCQTYLFLWWWDYSFLNCIKSKTCLIRFGSIFICVTFMFYLKTCLHWDKWCNLPLKIKIIKVIIMSGFCWAVLKRPWRKENMAERKKL